MEVQGAGHGAVQESKQSAQGGRCRMECRRPPAQWARIALWGAWERRGVRCVAGGTGAVALWLAVAASWLGWVR